MPSASHVVPAWLVQKVRALVEQMGDRRASFVLGLSPLTICRVLADRPVTRGTILQLERVIDHALETQKRAI